MTSTAARPAFLKAFQQHWPFMQAQPCCTLVSARFEQQQLTDEDFINAGISAPNAVRKRQAEYLSARLCARQALMVQTGQEGLPTPQENSRAPAWPTQSCGSMSHSHGISAAIVGDTQRWQSLGLDIEKPLKIERAQRLFSTILTSAEQQYYQSLDAHSAAWYLTYVFSFKESLFKALNPLTDVYFTFQDAQVLDFEIAEMGRARLLLGKQLSSEWQVGNELEGQFARLHGSAITLVSVPAATNNLHYK
jgi:enterobactin synthetase component D